jgi:hypothetical protein
MRKLAVVLTAAVLVAGCASHDKSAPSARTTAPNAASNTLRGATVSLTANYPTADDVFTNTVTGKVPVSWPKGTLYATRSPMVQVLASFDVADNTVTETFLTATALAAGMFNGPVYTFKGAPPITNVTVDPNSDHTVDPVNISFTANSISVNDSGLHVTDGAKQILRVEFSTL